MSGHNAHWRFVEVAAAERILSGGLGVAIEHGAGFCVAYAPEALADAEIERLLAAEAAIGLVLTRERLEAIDPETIPRDEAVVLTLPPTASPSTVRALADPVRSQSISAATLRAASMRPAEPVERAAVRLAKDAGLLPSVFVTGDPVAGLPVRAGVGADAIEGHRLAVAQGLLPVAEAALPLKVAADTRLVAFRSRLGGPEHYAVLVGEPEAQDAPLCRLHSECFTGDVLGSMRCDCGEQLMGALRRMALEGSGVLIYLAQEGRGIGLVNKLRAYQLQSAGFDTVDANTHLGFEPDERDFVAAVTMLKGLKIAAVRLLTNNPAKVDALTKHGLAVVRRVPHAFTANAHNRFYLETKARRAGHLLDGAEPVLDGHACTRMT